MQSNEYGPQQARGLFSDTGFDRAWWRAVRGSRGICRVTSQLDVPDRVTLPTDRPLMIAANHSSLFDLIASLVFVGHFGMSGRFAVNSRFFANPAGGGFLRAIGGIPFSRDDRETAEQTMVDALIARQVTGIMPEGRITRPKDQVNGIGPIRPGLSRIARRSNAVIMPVAFVHSDIAWKPGTPLPKPRLGRHHVIAQAGALIDLTTDDHEGNAALVGDALGSLVMSGRSLNS